MLTTEEQRRILREQKAGYEFLRRFNLDEARRATFEQRLTGLLQVLRFVAPTNKPVQYDPDNPVAARWNKIRARYAETSR